MKRAEVVLAFVLLAGLVGCGSLVTFFVTEDFDSPTLRGTLLLLTSVVAGTIGAVAMHAHWDLLDAWVNEPDDDDGDDVKDEQ